MISSLAFFFSLGNAKEVYFWRFFNFGVRQQPFLSVESNDFSRLGQCEREYQTLIVKNHSVILFLPLEPEPRYLSR